MAMHRTLPPLKLLKSPLEFAIGQARYEPILTIEKGIPEIQNALRQVGFTNYAERLVEVEKRVMGQTAPAELTRFKQWELTHSNKRHSFIIDRESISLQTTEYITYEDFEQTFRIGLDALGEHAAPREARRIGLRYVDVITPTNGQPFSWYVCPKLLGPDLAVFGSRIGQSSESVLRTGQNRRLKIRYVEAIKGLGVPFDVLPIQLQFKSPIRRSAPFATLDSDHSDSNISEFTVEGVLGKLSGLHDILDQAFRQLVTADAIAYWEKP